MACCYIFEISLSSCDECLSCSLSRARLLSKFDLIPFLSLLSSTSVAQSVDRQPCFRWVINQISIPRHAQLHNQQIGLHSSLDRCLVRKKVKYISKILMLTISWVKLFDLTGRWIFHFQISSQDKLMFSERITLQLVRILVTVYIAILWNGHLALDVELICKSFFVNLGLSVVVLGSLFLFLIQMSETLSLCHWKETCDSTLKSFVSIKFLKM